MIAEALFVHALGLLQEQLHLPVRQDLRVFALYLHGGHGLGGVGLDRAGLQQVGVKGLDGGGGSGDGGGTLAYLRHVEQILVDGFLFHLPQIRDAAAQKPYAELVQIAYVGAEGIGGRMLLLGQIGLIRRNIVCHIAHSSLPDLLMLCAAAAAQTALVQGRTRPLYRSAVQTNTTSDAAGLYAPASAFPRGTRRTESCPTP